MIDKEISKLVGQAVDIAPFGEMRYWTGSGAHEIEPNALTMNQGCFVPIDVPEQGGLHLGIEWDIPRQFEQVTVEYASDPPEPKFVKLQYWNHNWPVQWAGGWTEIDDPYNGKWITARGDAKTNGRAVTYTFDPLDFTEIERAGDFCVFYRQSYRLRLLFATDVGVKLNGFRVMSTSKWRMCNLRIRLPDSKGCNISVRNGYIAYQKRTGKSHFASILYTDCARQTDPKLLPVPPDRTVVTVTWKPQGFSFAVEDVLTGPVLLPDLGVSVEQADTAAHSVSGPKPIFDRILDEPEQTFARASSEIPQLVKIRQGSYVPLGCDGGNRQEFGLRYNGNVFIDKHAMKVSGRDTAKLLLPGTRIEFKYPTMDPPDFREREDASRQRALDGWLPIYTTEWEDREIHFEKTDFSAYLYESPDNWQQKRGDEPTCLFSRVTIRNTSEGKRKVRLWIVIENPEYLDTDGSFVYAIGRITADDVPWPQPAIERRWVSHPYEAKILRAQIETHGKGTLSCACCTYEPDNISGLPNAVAYDIGLDTRSAHTIEMKIPFVSFRGSEGRSLIKSISYDAKHTEMAEYWRDLARSGARIDVPEEHINCFVKATLPHVAITADKDIKSGHTLLPAGTFDYNVCANESMHQIRSLDFTGHHDRAREYLMPFIHCQGTRPLHGKFHSQQGVLHGLRLDEETDYQGFNYNLDHGYVLFALCEHYLLTRDVKWGKKTAQNLIDACDFVTHEREYTKKALPGGELAPEYGLLPPGHLEDNPEWHYWYAVNAYCYRGMAATAVVLNELGHQDADRIADDAGSYRDDLRRSMKLHMELSPATKLADGTYIPFTPTRAGLYSRDLGWIRDSLYGPIHAIECGVLDANEPQSTWILKDSEDNVFVSKYRGRQVDLERNWFSHGGNTIQSGLLPMVMVYIKRNQPEHAIRCLFNALAQNLYRDVHCFTEHPVAAFGLGAGPFYKTPDECCWVNWLRHALLTEYGYDKLVLAPAVPREWLENGKHVSAQRMATYFGPMSYRIESEVDSGRLIAVINPPRRNAPKAMELRLRHPCKKRLKSVTVNGAEWHNYDLSLETVSLDPLFGKKMTVVARY